MSAYEGKQPPRWTTSWPEWYGIEGNTQVVPASDYDVLADRVEAVERDAARYRCWRDRTVASNQPAAKCDDWLYSAMDDNNADTLDARVDAALKEQADANS